MIYMSILDSKMESKVLLAQIALYVKVAYVFLR